MNKSASDIKSEFREIALDAPDILTERNGRWQIRNRLAVWKTVAHRLLDSDLEKISKLAFKVLSEKDPQFDLPSEKRFMSGIYGKAFNHSRELRNGIAETLALVGSFPEFLTNCSPGKSANVCSQTVRSLLATPDWVTWASLNEILPLIAESSPQTFLDSLEDTLTTFPATVKDLFAQEGDGFTGRTYISGMLWALETIAWDSEYFVRAVLCLAKLAELDPGGKYGNRPSNSLAMILLPWYPQTTASLEKRLAAVKIVSEEYQNVGWKLILELLPNSHTSSIGTHKPRFRSFVPEDWKDGVTLEELKEQNNCFADLALNLAVDNANRILDLIERINNLPTESRALLLRKLEIFSKQIPESDSQLIWEALAEVLTRNIRHSQAKWSLPKEELIKIRHLMEILAPDDPKIRFRMLFDGRDFELYESTDFEREQGMLQQKRKSAIEEIYMEGGVDSVLNFVQNVKLPVLVGAALAEWSLSNTSVTKKISDELLPKSLDSLNGGELGLLQGFVAVRARTVSAEWLPTLQLSSWSADQIARFLSFWPFNRRLWEIAQELLGDESKLFWKVCNPNGFDLNTKELSFAVDQLLENSRHYAAIDLLVTGIYRGNRIASSQIIRAIDSLNSEDIRNVGADSLATLIKYIQEDPDSEKDDVARLEWTFLSLLDGFSGGTPVVLEAQMAASPELFSEIIELAFKSSKEASVAKNLKIDVAKATNAFRLLNNWKTPPGSVSGGGLDREALRTWLDSVKARSEETGHIVIALQRVGAVLFYSPPDPDGLWLHRAAAEVLNSEDGGDLRTGFQTEIINSRGAHFVDPTGSAESELATEYRRKADEIENAGYFRVATMLREVSVGYELEAESVRARTMHEEDLM